MNASIARFPVLLVVAVTALVQGGCASTAPVPAYYSRAYYGPGPWDRYCYRPAGAAEAGDPLSPQGPVAVAVSDPPSGTLPLPEVPAGVPAMGMPDIGSVGLDPRSPVF